jgi:DNA-directed RNA polymerase subunit RPC12/RpoP
MPTLKQIEKNDSHDLDKLRNRCEKIVSALEAALSSPVFNITIGTFSEIPCMRCGEKVRRRLPLSGDDVEAKCFTCGAEYKITGNHSDETSMWQALYEDISCPTEQCDSRLRIWKDQAKEGMRLSCDKCGKKYRIGLAMLEDC